MTSALGLTRREAVTVGQLLLDRGIIRHVLEEHGFEDSKLFYQFCADDPARETSGRAVALGSSPSAG
jgi:hypothetical protein